MKTTPPVEVPEVITRDRPTVWVNEPATPVMLSEYEPMGVVALVVTDSVDEPVAGFGLSTAVAPVGNPLTLRFTRLVKPPAGMIVKL